MPNVYELTFKPKLIVFNTESYTIDACFLSIKPSHWRCAYVFDLISNFFGLSTHAPLYLMFIPYLASVYIFCYEHFSLFLFLVNRRSNHGRSTRLTHIGVKLASLINLKRRTSKRLLLCSGNRWFLFQHIENSGWWTFAQYTSAVTLARDTVCFSEFLIISSSLFTPEISRLWLLSRSFSTYIVILLDFR